MKVWVFILFVIGLLSCNEDTQQANEDTQKNNNSTDSIGPGPNNVYDVKDTSLKDTLLKDLSPTQNIYTGSTTPVELMQFAETQIGVPYVYSSCDPKVGFDCSGFITYVFNHFHIQVPRSSYEFTHMGRTVPLSQAKGGDIILFTGTDSLATDVGHIGLVVSNDNGVMNFIHATSGKAMAVTVTTFDSHYKKRFVRIARIFWQNG